MSKNYLSNREKRLLNNLETIGENLMKMNRAVIGISTKVQRIEAKVDMLDRSKVSESTTTGEILEAKECCTDCKCRKKVKKLKKNVNAILDMIEDLTDIVNSILIMHETALDEDCCCEDGCECCGDETPDEDTKDPEDNAEGVQDNNDEPDKNADDDSMDQEPKSTPRKIRRTKDTDTHKS